MVSSLDASAITSNLVTERGSSDAVFYFENECFTLKRFHPEKHWNMVSSKGYPPRPWSSQSSRSRKRSRKGHRDFDMRGGMSRSSAALQIAPTSHRWPLQSQWLDMNDGTVVLRFFSRQKNANLFDIDARNYVQRGGLPSFYFGKHAVQSSAGSLPNLSIFRSESSRNSNWWSPCDVNWNRWRIDALFW